MSEQNYYDKRFSLYVYCKNVGCFAYTEEKIGQHFFEQLPIFPQNTFSFSDSRRANNVSKSVCQMTIKYA